MQYILLNEVGSGILTLAARVFVQKEGRDFAAPDGPQAAPSTTQGLPLYRQKAPRIDEDNAAAVGKKTRAR